MGTKYSGFGSPAFSRSVVASAAQAAAQSPRLNRWLSALANVRAGIGNAKVLCLGDSTTVGAGAGTGSGYLVGASSKNIANCLKAQLIQLGVNASVGSLMGDQNVFFSPLGANYGQYDTRTSFSGASNVQDGNAYVFGGIMFTPNPSGSTPAGSYTFTPTETWDTAIFYNIGNITGSAKLSVDGGITTLATITASGTNALAASAPISVSRGTPTLSVIGISGALASCGIWTYDSTTPKVHIFTGGMYGSKIDTIASTARYYHPGNAAPWSLFNFDLVIIDMAINSMVIDGIAGVSNFTSKMQAVISNAIAAGASVILVTPQPVSTGSLPAATAQAYINAIVSLGKLNNIPVVSFNERWNGSWSSMNGYGLYADDRHMKHQGYQDKATAHSYIIARPS